MTKSELQEKIEELKKSIEESEENILDMESRIEDLEVELEWEREPKKYVYNYLSFVSNSDATDVDKYIEDLHQTIAQNNEELDEYVKKIVKLKERMEDKDKVIKNLEQQLAEKDEKIELLKNNQNQKVIKCLKEVEKIIYEDFTIIKDSKAIKYIDNKIKELEEDK